MKTKIRCVVALAGTMAFSCLSAEVRVCHDIAYRPSVKTGVLDLSVPTTVTGFPTVVWFHGGGLTGGHRHFIDIDTNRIAVAAVEYRLMQVDNTGTAVPGGAVSPAMILDDCAAAAAWVRRHIASYGGDATRVFVSGHSAGGYVTHLLGLDAKWLKPYDLTPFDFAGYLPISGQATKHFAVRQYFGQGADPLRPVLDDWAPIHHIAAKTPPFCLLLGDRKIEWPMRVEESEFMYRSMKAMGNKSVEFHSFPGTNHGTCLKPALAHLVQFIDSSERGRTAPAARADEDMSADAIVNGVHGYMPDNYVVPKEPEVRERLEWFKDQKLAIMMHFGMYSQMGIFESWALCDKEEAWSRVQIDWTDDAEAFKRQYWDLWKSFNPVRFQPKKWARLAKDNGFKYIIFTTKHHDGFCLFDTKYTDFKVTNPACPFSKDPHADIVRSVFDAFRAEGLGIAAYFSKPDWHNEDYWEDHGMGRRVTRMPTYDVKENPEKWAKFRAFTKNQIVELVRDYGPVDVIWLDGGQVQRKTGLDIGIEDIIAEARKYKPDLISADRTAGGSCENVITPEQQVPPQPLAVPWESCITMGTGFSYRYDDEYKSPRELVHLLLDVIAKGGNLALNVAPGPDGRLPQPAIARMEALGAWLRSNGAGVYATRPARPFAKEDWRFTGSKDGKTVYAFRLWKNGERDLLAQAIPCENPGRVVRVKHLGTGIDVPFKVVDGGLAIRLPETFRTHPHADGFMLTFSGSSGNL